MPPPRQTSPMQASTMKQIIQTSPGSSRVTTLTDLANKKNDFLRFKETDDAKALVAWAHSQYTRMKSARASIQRQWYMNLAMYSGNQYLELLGVGAAAGLRVPMAPRSRVRARINRLQPIVRTEISRMTSQKPSAYVIPASGSDDDLFAANAGEQVWESIYSRNQFNKYNVRNAFWVATLGNGFIKQYWDQSKDDPFAEKPEGSQQPSGDICFGVVTPFNLFVPDLLEQDIEDQPFVLQAYTRPIEWARRFFKDSLSGNISADVVSQNEIFETRYFEPNASDNNAKPDSVLIFEVYCKPGGHKLYPNGGMFTVVGQELVQFSETMPYSHGEYPYSHVQHVPTGKFYGDSVLTALNPLQKEYNRTRSQILESKNKLLRNQFFYRQGSIDPNRWTTQSGEMVPVKPGFEYPQAVQNAPLPNWVLQELDRIQADMEDISGQHQVSRGMAPGSGVTAATAIAFLQDKDDSLMATTYGSIEYALEKTARQTLNLVVDYWTIPRTIRTVGLDSAFDALQLKGADVKNGLDIRIEAGSALPTARPARQALIMDLGEKGFIGPDDVLKYLDLGGMNNIAEERRRDERQAMRENLKMKVITNEQIQQYAEQLKYAWDSGQPGTVDPQTQQPLYMVDDPTTWPPMVPVNSWDNHQEHIRVHNNYRKGQEFEMLTPAQKLNFDNHVKMHQQALMSDTFDMQRTGFPPPSGNPPPMISGPGMMPQGGQDMPPAMPEGGGLNG